MSTVDTGQPPAAAPTPPTPGRPSDRIVAAIAGLLVAAVVAIVIALLVIQGDDDGALVEAESTTSVSEVTTTVEDDGGEASTTSTEASTTTTSAPAASTSQTTAASSTTATTAKPEPSCSAAGSSRPGPQADLPSAVADKRAAILAAALACDLDGLAALTGPDFTVSFGGGDPVDVWEAAEATGDGPMRFLVELLAMPYATQTIDDRTIYVWPSAFAAESWADVTAADREALAKLYDEQAMTSFEQFGGYIGYRIGIDQDGEWMFFVAGD